MLASTLLPSCAAGSQWTCTHILTLSLPPSVLLFLFVAAVATFPSLPFPSLAVLLSDVVVSVCAACCVVACCVVLAFSRYNVTWLNAAGQSLTAYTNPPTALTSPSQNPLGPFVNSTYLIGASDSSSMAGTWQMPVNLPWPFTFFGVNYTAITVTSKGFMYFGAYDYMTDLQNLEQAATSPDYSSGGSGFPTINGVSRPVLSFFHSATGGVPTYDLVNYGSLGCLMDGTVSQSGGGQCVLADYYWQVLPPMSATMMVTNVGPRKVLTSVYITPVNSVATPADGQRFVLTALDLRDASGAQGQAVVVLYQSGLIEMYWYQISQSQLDPYTGATSLAATTTFSVGIQSLVGNSHVFFSTPANTPSMNMSQQLFSSLGSSLKQSCLSFQPLYA